MMNFFLQLKASNEKKGSIFGAYIKNMMLKKLCYTFILMLFTTVLSTAANTDFTGVSTREAAKSSTQIAANWGKVFRYGKGGEMSAIEHIMYRHAANSGFSGVSKFSQGTTARMIKGYVDEALKLGKPILQNDGSYMLRYNVGRTIGTGANGAAASDIMIYMREGWIRTAFPIN